VPAGIDAASEIAAARRYDRVFMGESPVME
jgi:hypothetical protein